MTAENKFYNAMIKAGNFINVDYESELFHPTLPGEEIESDNIGQRGKTIFLFEGKLKDKKTAIKQLQIRQKSLESFKNDYIKILKILNNYDNFRLFYYTFKQKKLIEFHLNGDIIKTYNFEDLDELAEILRNL